MAGAGASAGRAVWAAAASTSCGVTAVGVLLAALGVTGAAAGGGTSAGCAVAGPLTVLCGDEQPTSASATPIARPSIPRGISRPR